MLLSMKGKQQIAVIMAVLDGQATADEAGKVLKRPARQICRIMKNVREEAINGVIHKSRGRESPRELPENTGEDY
jgi:hypothetical protein